MLRSEFWPTAAQVMPVLALAIIVEARATINRWSDRIPVWLRFIQGALWVSPLILFVYLEPVAFRVIAGQENPASSVNTAIFAITLSLSVLIAAPALELLIRSNAKIVATFYTVVRTFRLRLEIASTKRQCKRLLKEIPRRRDECLEQLAQVARIGLELAMADDRDSEENREMRQVAARVRKDIQVRLEQTEQSTRNLTEIMQKLTQGAANIKNVNSQFVSEMSKELTKMENFGGPSTE
jgi:hypothetical protein